MTSGEHLAAGFLNRLHEQDRKDHLAAVMRDTMLHALPVARDAGLSAQELADAWALPRRLIVLESDRIHRHRRR